jgi:hypothetical protein
MANGLGENYTTSGGWNVEGVKEVSPNIFDFIFEDDKLQQDFLGTMTDIINSSQRFGWGDYADSRKSAMAVMDNLTNNKVYSASNITPPTDMQGSFIGLNTPGKFGAPDTMFIQNLRGQDETIKTLLHEVLHGARGKPGFFGITGMGHQESRLKEALPQTMQDIGTLFGLFEGKSQKDYDKYEEQLFNVFKKHNVNLDEISSMLGVEQESEPPYPNFPKKTDYFK